MARNRWKFAAVLMLVLALFAAACGSDDGGSSGGDETATTAGGDETATTAGGDAAEEFKVAFVHVGPTADKGWSWAHDQGAKFLENKMPGVKITADSRDQ